MSSLTAQDYYIGWICALNKELTAAMAMLDEEHEMIAGQDPQDHNSYVLGRIHQHNVVIACMPEGVDGLVPAANVAKDMARTFPALRIGLMVGIGGGIPDLSNGIDIRLGDIVVSKPEKSWGGVVQYDKGKAENGGKFVIKGQLNQPPTLLLQTLAQLRARHAMRPSKVPDYIKEAVERHPMMEETGFTFPDESDYLYCSVCHKDIESSVADCEGLHTKRKQRKHNKPMVHYGVIASGNQVVKDAAVRDRLRDEFNALCVEMEAAGLMNEFPCLVIRGICDYSDSHKNDAWHPYAAMTAAAYAKEFLLYISPMQASQEQPIKDVLGFLGEIRHTSKAQLKATKTQTQQNKTQYESDRHNQCHQTFKIGPYEEQKDINPERIAGTCQWVLSHPQYLQWLGKAHDDLLWISADPGCGKSVLAKSFIDNELRATDKHTVCYFFFKDNEEQDTIATALCALLHQLFTHQPRLIRHVFPAWEKNGDKLQMEVPELWRTLLAAANDGEAHDVTCVLDALDECRLSDRRWLINMLARFYTQIPPSPSATRPGRLKFLATSRPYDDIQAEFQKIIDDLPTIRLRGEEENDQIHQEIDLVIRMRVANLAKDLRLNPQIKDQLEGKLLKMEHRTYLWLYLAIEGIYETYRDSIRPEDASIESLPSTVEDAYDKILSRVTDKQRGTVQKILQIVIGARRPLTVREMAIALGIATSTHLNSLQEVKLDPLRLENNIRHWCGLFIFINHARIYLIHQTAKEFLIYDRDFTIPPSGWKHCLDPGATERDMTRICVEFLCLDDTLPTAESLVQKFSELNMIDDILEKDDSVESLLVYSAEYWPSHFRDADMLKNESRMASVAQLYNTDSTLYRLWFTIFWKTTYPYEEQPQMNSIRLAALLGHERLLQSMLESNNGYDINASDTAGRTALVWASRLGHEKVAQMLLDKGADVNAKGGEYGNALLEASARGHEKVVQMLLNKGVKVNADGGFYGNALQAASSSGHEKVVLMLLDKGAKVNPNGGYYGNALQAASAGGYEKVVQILLDKGAEVNTEGGRYGNALQAASYRGHEKVVLILLDKGAKVSADGGEYGNALQAASYRGHEKVVLILLDKGAKVSVDGGEYGNALQAASVDGHEKVVQILLDKGAKIDAEGGYYGNALQAASAGGHEKVVQILLDKGVKTNAEGGRYGNALQAASAGGHEKVVQMLLNKGAKVNANGGYYGNSLQAASFGGHEKVVQMLLDKGAGVNAEGGYYGNALQAASYRGHEKVVQMLLDKGAEINTNGGKYGNALQAASANGHEKVVQMLLDKGAEVNTNGGEYGNALQAASVDGHGKVVQMLLDKGAEVNADGGKFGNALQAASVDGDEKVVEMLLDKGAEINADGGEYGNALQAASANGHYELVLTLLDKGAEINVNGGYYGNSLQAASYRGHEKVVQIFLDKGVKVNPNGGEYGNALQAASVDGHEKVVQMLLDKGAEVNTEGGRYGNALQAASVDGHEKVVQMLLDKGAEVNTKGGKYGSALRAASANGHEKVVQMLLDKGAEVNAKVEKEYGSDQEKSYCRTPLSWAAANGHTAVVKLLMERGDAEADLKDDRGRTPLSWAAANGHAEVVKLLMEQDNVEVNSKDDRGRTPLLWAAATGRETVVRLLLAEKVVDQKSQDLYGQIPLSLAAGNGHETVVNILTAEDSTGLSSKDSFGRTPLSWAAKKGHSNVVDIIRKKHLMNGMVICAEDINLGTSPASHHESEIFCDICLSDIPNVDIHHHCGICDYGDFDVCQDCLLCGAFCLDDSHKMAKRTFENGVLVELTD